MLLKAGTRWFKTWGLSIERRFEGMIPVRYGLMVKATMRIQHWRWWSKNCNLHKTKRLPKTKILPPDPLLLDRSPNIGPLISRWELDKFKTCRNKSFRTSKTLKLLYQQFPNLLISQQDIWVAQDYGHCPIMCDRGYYNLNMTKRLLT